MPGSIIDDTGYDAVDRAMQNRNFDGAVAMLRSVPSGRRDVDYFLRLASAIRAAGDVVGAIGAIDQALAIEPLGFLPLLMRARLAELAHERDTGEWFRRAVFHAPAADALSPALRGQLARARAFADAHEADRARRLDEARYDGTLDPAGAHRVARFVTNATGRTAPFAQTPTHYHYPGLPVIEFLDPILFPGLTALEAANETIRGELQQLLVEGLAATPYVQYTVDAPLAQWQALNNSHDWSAIHLWRNGRRVDAFADRCPETMRLYDALDRAQIDGCSPNLMFSLLAPGAHIPPHSGVNNTRCVFHLPLIVPSACRFRVGGETRPWRVGEAWVFDDTIEHEAWNDSQDLRVVLIGDLWRPELAAAERAAIARIIGADGGVAHLGL